MRSSVGGRSFLTVLILLLGSAYHGTAHAQTNSWSNISGGYWDDFRNWDLHARPTNSESVFITNAPSKIVTVDGYTSGTYPESMTISDLTVSADVGITNTLFLSDAGSITPLTIQDALVIAGGGALFMTNSSLEVGGPAGGEFLLEGPATLSGTNSFAGGICVGFSTNSAGFVFVTDGLNAFTNAYTIIGFYGSGQVVQSGGLIQAGDDIAPPNGVFLGLTAGSQGSWTLAGGTTVVPEHLDLGEDLGSTGSVWITGGQLILTNNYLTTIGNNGAGQLVLSNGQFLASHLTIANGSNSVGVLTIVGGTANLSGSLVGGNGIWSTGSVFIAGGQLAVTNGGIVIGSYGAGQMTVSNGTFVARNVNVGNSTCSNSIGSLGTLMIRGGNTAVSNLVAGVFSNANGVVQLAGGNLTVTSPSGTGQLVIGQYGKGLLVQNGGTLTVDQLSIGSGSASNFVAGLTTPIFPAGNGQVILSNGVLIARTVSVGMGTNSQAILTIAGGSMSITSSLTAGVFFNSTGTVQVTGGKLTVTGPFLSAARLVVGQAGLGTFTQSGGVVTVDQLLVTNGTSSVFNLNSGLFNTKSTTVNNAQTFAVGDGVGAATYHLLGGTHSFANGLEVRNNSVLSGCGTIVGSVVVDPGGSLLTDCGGALTFTGIVTNNGTWTAIHRSVLESFGPVVNNGVINIIGGNTNFHSGFVNNGAVLTASNIPRINSVSRAGIDLAINFLTFAGLTNVVEYTGNIVSPSWTPLTSFIGPGGVTNITDPGAAAAPQRFYRIRLMVPQ